MQKWAITNKIQCLDTFIDVAFDIMHSNGISHLHAVKH